MGFLKKVILDNGYTVEYWTLGTCQIDYLANYIEIEILGYASKEIADAEGFACNYLMSGSTGNHLNEIPNAITTEYLYNIIRGYDNINFCFIGAGKNNYTFNFKDAEII